MKGRVDEHDSRLVEHEVRLDGLEKSLSGNVPLSFDDPMNAMGMSEGGGGEGGSGGGGDGFDSMMGGGIGSFQISDGSLCTNRADYAEWMERHDHSENVCKGDVRLLHTPFPSTVALHAPSVARPLCNQH